MFEDYLNKKRYIYNYGKLPVLILLIKKKLYNILIWYIDYYLINSQQNQHKQIFGGIDRRRNR